LREVPSTTRAAVDTTLEISRSWQRKLKLTIGFGIRLWSLMPAVEVWKCWMCTGSPPAPDKGEKKGWLGFPLTTHCSKTRAVVG